MQNNQCQCYDGFTGSDCGDRVDLTETIKDGSYQVIETIKGYSCQNGAPLVTNIGYCLCNVGFTGPTCGETDNLTKQYYSAPAGSTTTSCGNYN